MLVINAQEGDIIQIGDDIRILIKRERTNRLSMSVDAPATIKIERLPADIPERAMPEVVQAVLQPLRRR